jgi:mRNA interferase RelE/StbE
MPEWTIVYTDTARRQLHKLDKNSARRILEYMEEKIASLESVRSIGKPLRGVLGDLWRYRVGDYRIVCELHDKELRVLVVRVGNRKNVYR